MTVPYTIAVGPTTLTRAGNTLTAVQVTVPSADLPYCWAGLVRVGLNVMHHRLGKPDYAYVAGDFPDTDGTATVDIDVEDDDDARAAEIGAAFSIATVHVVSAAARLGAARMMGVNARTVGPLE